MQYKEELGGKGMSEEFIQQDRPKGLIHTMTTQIRTQHLLIIMINHCTVQSSLDPMKCYLALHRVFL